MQPHEERSFAPRDQHLTYPESRMADEMMTAVPTREALDAAHLQAMRSQSDQLSMLNRLVGDMGKDLREARDAVLELKAQDLKSLIAANRAETLALIAANRAEAVASCKEVDDKTEANARAISLIRGVFLPLGAVGATALAFLGQFFANVASGHH